MSLLINESYANTAQPLWVGANGGTIGGNLTVNGNITTTPAGLSSISTGGLYIKDAGNTTRLAMGYTGNNGQILCNPGNAIVLTQSGSTGNTTFTPAAQGSGLDNLTVGGSVGCNKLRLRAGIIAGTSTIAVGQTTIVIPATGVEASSLVFLQFNSPAVAGPANGGAQGNLTVDPASYVVGTSFTVQHTDVDGVITAVADQDCTFNWMVVNFV